MNDASDTSFVARPEKVSTTVLFVDDDTENLRDFSELLEGLGYRVLAAGSAERALLLLGQNERVDLVITDYRMPGMDGLELVAALRKLLPEAPVIVLTAHGDVDAYFKAFSLGVFEYVNKPVGKAEFARIVRTASAWRSSPPPGGP